jgi:hypothetical protein
MTNVPHGIVIRVGQVRRDGKYPVTFLYQSTGNRLSKIMTAEQVREQWAKAEKEPGLYQISGMRGRPL